MVDGLLKPGSAARKLRLTVRQAHRLVMWYCAEGPSGLVWRWRNRPSNRPSNNQIDKEIVQIALTIIRQRYADFGPTLACEKLRELHGVNLSKETIRKLMSDVGLWVPRSQRPARIHRMPLVRFKFPH